MDTSQAYSIRPCPFMPLHQKPKIVLVDDDPTFGHIMEAVALSHGLTLTYFQSVREAYRHIEETRFDIAIIDYDLGQVTGVQFGRHLDRIAGKVPVVLVSALKMPKETQWPAPVAHFISKKEDPETVLLEVVRVYQDSLNAKIGRKAG